jgi:hypothetical protein
MFHKSIIANEQKTWVNDIQSHISTHAHREEYRCLRVAAQAPESEIERSGKNGRYLRIVHQGEVIKNLHDKYSCPTAAANT